MTDHDLQVAKDIGQMQADIRTVKHDLANIQQGMIALGAKLDTVDARFTEKVNQVSSQQQRGLGFFAGMAFIIATFGAAMIFLAKLVFVGGGAGGAHP